MNEKVLTIALDADGVMCSFTGGVLQYVNYRIKNQEHGPLLTDDDITQWNVSAALGLTEAEDKSLVAHIKSEGFCAGLDVIPGTLEAVTALREFARVICVTSPYPSKHWEWERRQWLESKLGFSKKDTVFADDKSLVKADILLDDKLETIRAYPYGWPVLFEQPWNTRPGVMDEMELLRISNWGEFVRLCQERNRRFLEAK